MSRWFLVNFALFLFVSWKVFTGHFGIHILFGMLGFTFFIINWMRHAMFSTIRSNISRKRKIKFANISKKAMPWHKWFGTLAFVFVVIHMVLVIHRFGFEIDNYKMTFGLMAFSIMLLTVILGWLRWLKTTVQKRILHLSLAFTLFYMITIHVLL